MPFSKQKNKKIKQKAMHSPGIMARFIYKKRVLSFASTTKAAITLETTLLMTIYLSIMIPIISLLSVINLQSNMQIHVENVTRDLANKVYYTEGVLNTDIAQTTIEKLSIKEKSEKSLNQKDTQSDKESNPNGSQSKQDSIDKNDSNTLTKQIISRAAFASLCYGSFVSKVGARQLNDSYIVGGIAGLDFSESMYDNDNNVIVVRLRYSLKVPVLSGLIGNLTDERVAKAHTWCGKDITKNTEKVYITKNSEVYHTDMECTYLHRNVKSVPLAEIENIRNNSGKKYTKCSICGKTENTVYITKDGTKYHSSICCSSLNRNVMCVEKSEVVDMDCCSKCE